MSNPPLPESRKPPSPRRSGCWSAALVALALPAAAAAEASLDRHWNLRVGVGAAAPIEHDWSGVATLAVERYWRRFHGGRLSFDATLFALQGRRGGGDHDLVGDVQTLAFGVRWRHHDWLLGFAPAVASTRTDAISGSLKFVSTAGWQALPCCALLLQHISNGSTHGRNFGETMLLLEARFDVAD